eukprot:940309-Rhodomonas_salina.3
MSALLASVSSTAAINGSAVSLNVSFAAINASTASMNGSIEGRRPGCGSPARSAAWQQHTVCQHRK